MPHGLHADEEVAVIDRPWLRLAILGSLLACPAVGDAANQKVTPNQDLDRKFQAAQADYDVGKYAEAAAELEALLPYAEKSYELHELLGLVYASLPDSNKAVEHLQIAARLDPNSATAHTNLAVALFHAGKSQLAAEQFLKALELAPGDYDANHNLGEFYIESGKITEARPLLEKAQKIQPNAYDNGYDLAEAYFLTGELGKARAAAESLLTTKNTGELHNLLGHVEEKDGKFVEAANQYETAAHLDPSEQNIFDWGSEYLLHRTYDPAIEIFQQGSLRYPASPRMQMGLGMALYSRGKSDEAVRALMAAADLDPADARCYVFLSKAYDASPNQAEEVIQRFHRYARLQPNNALAQYYYAMSLWKGKRVEGASADLQTIESLLQKSVSLDASLAEAHVQLGDLYSDQHQWDKSIPQYQHALQLDANLPDAHYRLAQGYVHTGKKDEAQAEFAIYQKQRAEHLAAVDKERAEVQQFVYNAKAAPGSRP